MSGDLFNTPIYHHMSGKPVPGDLGIEIEAEGTKTGMNPVVYWDKNRVKRDAPMRYWQAKGDNSLRNGLEYVTMMAVPIEKLHEAMDEWVTTTQGTRFRHDSIRTSVHYHVNVSHLTPIEILTAVMGWWLLETPVVDLQGPTRVGNLFCLRVSDAEHLVNDLLASIEHDPLPLLGQNLNDNVKYAALNLNAIRRFGSLEFRFNRGTTDPHEIERWGKFLHGMVRAFARMKHPQQLIELFETQGPEGLVDHVCPLWLRTLIRQQQGWQDKINTNYSYAYMIHAKLRDVSGNGAPIREIHRPFIALDPETQDYPFDDPRKEYAGRFDLTEYSPDEEAMPQFRFKIGNRYKKRKKVVFGGPPAWMLDPPPPPPPPGAAGQVNWQIIDEVIAPDLAGDDFPDDVEQEDDDDF
jgi:hypothetical protein